MRILRNYSKFIYKFTQKDFATVRTYCTSCMYSTAYHDIISTISEKRARMPYSMDWICEITLKWYSIYTVRMREVIPTQIHTYIGLQYGTGYVLFKKSFWKMLQNFFCVQNFVRPMDLGAPPAGPRGPRPPARIGGSKAYDRLPYDPICVRTHGWWLSEWSKIHFMS